MAEKGELASSTIILVPFFLRARNHAFDSFPFTHISPSSTQIKLNPRMRCENFLYTLNTSDDDGEQKKVS